jgi:hypothetical protein
VSDAEGSDRGYPPGDPRDLRCSDADREQVAEVVRQAAGDGRLTLDELGDRLDIVYSARTYRDLEPAVRDLPGARLPALPPGALPHGGAATVPGDRRPGVSGAGSALPVAHSSGTSAVAIFSETKRSGAWLVPVDYAGVAVLGSVELDLREVTFAGPVTQIQANAVLGEVKVIVGEGVTVNTIGTPVMGEYNGPHEEPVEGTPHVTLNGLALFGSVEVTRKKPRKRRR